MIKLIVVNGQDFINQQLKKFMNWRFSAIVIYPSCLVLLTQAKRAMNFFTHNPIDDKGHNFFEITILSL